MSGASKSNTASGMSGSGWPGANVLNIRVPLLFILAGITSLLVAISLIFLRPEVLTTYHYNQYVIAITHLVVLGWIGSVVMGAMYQLVPVALETRLFSQKLAGLQFALHLVGFCGMVWMFWTWNMKQVGHFGSILGAGVLVFIYNLFRTLLRVPRWNVVATAIASTLFWLALTVSVGLIVVAGKCSYDLVEATVSATWQTQLIGVVAGIGKWAARFDQMGMMHAHAHVGVVGVFLMLIIGVSYRLVPMFTLSDIQKPRRAMASVLLLNLGLVGAFCAIVARSQLRILFTGIAVLGLLLYGLELRAILRARKRRVIDWAVKSFLTGLLLLLFLSPLALLLSWPGLPLNNFTGQLENAYGFVALFGLVSFAILGMLYKILPFLVWYHSYSRKIGTARVPSLADLYSPRVQVAGFVFHLAGLLGAIVAILAQNAWLVRSATVLLGLGALLLFWNVGRMIQHVFWPLIEPLNVRPATDEPAVRRMATTPASTR
jgi:hypothetical protein